MVDLRDLHSKVPEQSLRCVLLGYLGALELIKPRGEVRPSQTPIFRCVPVHMQIRLITEDCSALGTGICNPCFAALRYQNVCQQYRYCCLLFPCALELGTGSSHTTCCAAFDAL